MEKFMNNQNMGSFIKTYASELVFVIGISILVILSIGNIIDYNTFIVLDALVCIVTFWLCLKRPVGRHPISKKTFLFLIVGEFLMMLWNLQ